MSRFSSLIWLLLPLSSALTTLSTLAQEQGEQMEERTVNSGQYKAGLATERPRFGGPTSPEGQIEEADRVKEPAFRFPAIDGFFQPWTDAKKSLNDNQRLALSGHYSIQASGINDVAPLASEQPGQDLDSSSASGVFRANVRWTALKNGEDTASLYLTWDHRHSYTSTAPMDLASSAGYLGVANTFYNDMGGAVINLNWQQSFNHRSAGLIAGRYDPNDYQVVHGGTNPWAYFSNIALVLDPSVAFPDSSWGVGGGSWFGDKFYAIGGVNDANGNGGDELAWFDGGNELYKWAHVGFSPSKEQRYFQNIHVSVWHADERSARLEDDFAGAEQSDGFTTSMNWLFAETWMPFARYGRSWGSAPIYNESATLGLMKQLSYRSDVLGIAVNWGDPAIDSLKDQITTEAFWQFQFSQNLEITPSIQYLNNPALNPEEDAIFQAGVRVHLSF